MEEEENRVRTGWVGVEKHFLIVNLGQTFSFEGVLHTNLDSSTTGRLNAIY